MPGEYTTFYEIPPPRSQELFLNLKENATMILKSHTPLLVGFWDDPEVSYALIGCNGAEQV